MSDSQWQPSASLDTLKQRAQLIQGIRQFFTERNILEVETPALSRAAIPDPALVSFKTAFDQQVLYLHTSPEFFMKRMLAAGFGAMYQIARVFRDDECGKRHNPEFTLLEWYRPGFDIQQLMLEVEGLVIELVHQLPIKIAPAQQITYQELFLDVANVDPFTATKQDWQAGLAGHGIELAYDQVLSATQYCDLFMSHIIEPAMPAGLCFVYDYPVDQASLAQVRLDTPPVAERFELYFNGVELANGFHELTDTAEQRKRFVQESRERVRQGLAAVPVDEKFLSALESGLPDCSGVAMGIDRLIMMLLGHESIDDVMAFPYTGV